MRCGIFLPFFNPRGQVQLQLGMPKKDRGICDLGMSLGAFKLGKLWCIVETFIVTDDEWTWQANNDFYAFF